MNHIEFLNAAHIVHIIPAARKAGLKFRNGLTKSEIITLLSRNQAMLAATCAVIEAMRKAHEVGPNWIDDDEPASPNVPARMPESPPVPASSAAGVQVDPTLFKLLLERIAALEGNAPYLPRKEVTPLRDNIIAELIRAASDGRIPGFGKTEIRIGDLPPIELPEGELVHPELQTLLTILLCGENAMLVGPASSGKTFVAQQVARILGKSLNRPDYRLCATGAVADGFALTGYRDAHGIIARPEFREAVEHGHLFLFDEIDASAADACLVINALDNGFVLFPDGIVPLHKDFRLIGSANTDGSGASLEYVRNRMDGAFRDRFAIIDWQIDARIEKSLSPGNDAWLNAVRAIRAFALDREIMDVVATARATRRGAKFQSAGMARERILEVTCKRGALRDCWPDILRLPAVSAYLRG